MAVSAKSKARAGKARRGASPETQARQARVELAASTIDDEAPDYGLFLRRWGNRYSESNLQRLWVQAPGATCLHRFGTWRGMGRQVRTGEHAIFLRIPRTSRSEDKVTPENPSGEIFHGAPWMAMFDFSQTDPIGDFADDADGADPDLAAEVKRLRFAATRLHPDMSGQDTAAAFMRAWAAYESAKARLTEGMRTS